jgi:type I restriction enzyme R subunit
VLGRQYHLITRDDRLETVARTSCGTSWGECWLAVGKAMVVSIDKATALRMHDKVKVHWAAETARVQKELGELALPARAAA